MKDEFKGIPINKFTGLKTKCIPLFLKMVKKLTQQRE